MIGNGLFYLQHKCLGRMGILNHYICSLHVVPGIVESRERCSVKSVHVWCEQRCSLLGYLFRSMYGVVLLQKLGEAGILSLWLCTML